MPPTLSRGQFMPLQNGPDFGALESWLVLNVVFSSLLLCCVADSCPTCSNAQSSLSQDVSSKRPWAKQGPPAHWSCV